MKLTKQQLKRIIKEEKAKVLAEQRLAPDAGWWEGAFRDVIADEAGYGELDVETNLNILAALEKMARELKDDMRGDAR